MKFSFSNSNKRIFSVAFSYNFLVLYYLCILVHSTYFSGPRAYCFPSMFWVGSRECVKAPVLTFQAYASFFLLLCVSLSLYRSVLGPNITLSLEPLPSQIAFAQETHVFTHSSRKCHLSFLIPSVHRYNHTKNGLNFCIRPKNPDFRPMVFWEIPVCSKKRCCSNPPPFRAYSYRRKEKQLLKLPKTLSTLPYREGTIE